MRAARAAILLAATALAGCATAPDYQPPASVAPAAYREAGPWTSATPMDGMPRGAWWRAFGDPVLDDLESRIERASPTLAAALARYDQAVALVRRAGTDYYPEVNVGGAASRERLSGRRPLAQGRSATFNDFSLDGTLSYEADLWGRVRNSVRAARADAEGDAADLASVRLSLQASLADAYFRLRGLDAQAALLRQTVAAYERAYDLTLTRHDGGIASGMDVSRARTLLSNARADLSQVANERAAVEHGIAALVGEVASSFSIPAAVQPLAPPDVPAGAPSALLQRRPDIAEAERRMAAANARIGVARSAFFPTVTLGLAGGFEAASGSLLSTPASYWALGPLSAMLNLFDGGRRRAEVQNARALFEEASADYRAAVLAAFREVEDGLASARHLATQAKDQRDAAAAAARTEDLALTRYRDGASDYLEVVIAQTASLDAQRTSLIIQTERMRTAVALIRALGGDYGAGGALSG
ncbi:RND transporter [Sphingomonas oleivorans]|uniref:RND transporter n=1 Tax=Sphingomonas oleivorans TaxID=1735121 RepID=A0A2T5G365_9SPHN|nr:efflux transporter outer membrane subunit [Sphingomonas oleivorans]PTQ13570.1 RND transporter [Sphingomonas oleivorans]